MGARYRARRERHAGAGQIERGPSCTRPNKAYPASFHDILVGNNSALEFDSDGNPVEITGFNAGNGWDATTGFGSPIDTSLVDYLIRYVSPGDGVAAVATTKPKPHPKPIIPGSMDPH